MSASKADLSERDICTPYITPAIQQAGWDLHAQVREEVTFTQGRIIVRGRLVRRGQTRRADYILSHKPNLPLAVVEAKDNTHSVGAGMQQALAYAEALEIDLDKDLLGWRPEHGKRGKHGLAIEDRVYNQQDFDRTLVLDQRTQLVARKVAELHYATDPYAKTIIFCEDIDHAERMRQALVNALPDLAGANVKNREEHGETKQGI